MQGDEITTDAQLIARYAELRTLYGGAPDEVVICPQLNPIPHPTLDQFRDHLAAGTRLPIVTDDDDNLVAVGLLTRKGHITAAWGPSDGSMRAASYALVEWLHDVVGRPYRLRTGVPGWIAREWFDAYMGPGDGDHFDVDRPRSEIGGRSLRDLDDEFWELEIRRTGDDGFESTVRVLS